MKTLTITFIIAILILCTGCNPVDAFKRLKENRKQEEAKQSSKAETQKKKQQIDIESEPGEGKQPANIKAEGLELGLPAGFKLKVTSVTDSKISEDNETQKNNSIYAVIDQAQKLPWGVYVAVIGLIVGGLIVAIKVNISLGLPLIGGGILVYGVFVTFNAYPTFAAVLVAIFTLAVIVGYVWYIRNAETAKAETESKGDVIRVLRDAVSNSDEITKGKIKAEIKKITGKPGNPVRDGFDAEIQGA